jgi:hypothetical protein
MSQDAVLRLHPGQESLWEESPLAVVWQDPKQTMHKLWLHLERVREEDLSVKQANDCLLSQSEQPTQMRGVDVRALLAVCDMIGSSREKAEAGEGRPLICIGLACLD